MSDDVDRAQAKEEAQREDALANRPAAPVGRWDRLSARWCEACGERIPDGRRRAIVGVKLCIDCRRDEELRKRVR